MGHVAREEFKRNYGNLCIIRFVVEKSRGIISEHYRAGRKWKWFDVRSVIIYVCRYVENRMP